MEQLNNVDVTKLHNPEALGFFMQIAGETKQLTVQADQAVVTAFKNATDAFENAMKPTLGSSYTEARKAADEVTDYFIVGVRKYADAQTYSPDEQVAAIAKKALKIIDKYGYLIQMSYKSEYPNLRTLLNELQAMPQNDVQKLGLAIWIQALEQAYANFMAITEDKVDEESEKQVGLVQETRTAAQEAYAAMHSRLNAGAEYMGDAPYVPFFSKANVIIAEYKALLDSRKTRSENKKDETEQE